MICIAGIVVTCLKTSSDLHHYKEWGVRIISVIMKTIVAPRLKTYSLNVPKTFSGNKLRLVRGGREYFDLLKSLINQATDTIHLQTYIYDDDETGTEIAEALMHAAQRGVKVYLLVDGYASRVMSQSFIDQLRAAGIHFRFFEPLFRSKYFYFGRRLHHKMFVADARYAVVGGINITNRYNDLEGQPAWLDFALYAEGDIAKELYVLCYKTWKGFPAFIGITSYKIKKQHFDNGAGGGCFVRMRRNDWVRGKNQISASYFEMLKNATSDITILSSYFLPGRLIRKYLVQAANRGVKIKVIMAGRSDVVLAKQAERYIYKELLKNKIEIYEYQKNILHGKIATCDNKWLTIGSYNVNNISAYASIELNLDVFNPVFTTQVNDMLEDIVRKDCICITPEYFEKNSNIFKRVVHWASYEIIRFIFYMCTFYFKQRA
jgi:cardiolipin synthase A/B